MRRCLALLLTFCLYQLAPGLAARAQAAIQFGPVTLRSNFPNGVSGEVEVIDLAGGILTANLACRVQGQAGTYRTPVAPAAGPRLRLNATWDTGIAAIPPGAQVLCLWEAANHTGAVATSAESAVAYEDTRFRWQMRQNEQVAVWWHDAPDALGALAFDLANRALEHQHRVTGSRLRGPVRVLLYNTHAEFAAWQPAVPAFVSGRSFPGFLVTAQVADAGLSQAEWLAAVIPHEISALFFHEATGGEAEAPAWLDEGLAMFDETAGHAREEQVLQAGVVRRALVPLADLATDMASADEAHVRLAQAEALSAMTYLMYRYGPDRLANLLAAYRAGLRSDAAFTTALGCSPEQFEDGWLMWVGVPAAWRVATPDPPAALPPVALRLSAQVASPAGAPASLAPAVRSEALAAPAAPRRSLAGLPILLIVAVLLAALALPALAGARHS